MSLLNYNEIKIGKIIVYEGEPCEVMDHHIARTQQRKPQNQTKLKSLITGKTFAVSFHVSDQAEEAEIGKREIKFLYHNRGEYWFCDPKNPGDRFQLTEKIAGEAIKFLKPNELATALTFGEDEEKKTIGLRLPIKVELKVTEAPPSIKGDTRTGGNKLVTLETGATINVPLFIESGDIIRINTETGEYVERV